MVKTAQRRVIKRALKRERDVLRKCQEAQERDVPKDHAEDAKIKQLESIIQSITVEPTVNVQKGLTLHAKKIMNILCF